LATPILVAHVRKDEDGKWDAPQLLKDHLVGTAELARKFAGPFDSEIWA